MGGLFCQVDLCQIHVAKLPPPCHQGYSASFGSSTSYCRLVECSPNYPKWISLQVAHCLGWFWTWSVIFGHNNNNNNNNLQFSIIPKKWNYSALELHSYFWHGRHAFFKICGKFKKVISLRLTSLGTTVIYKACWIGLCLGMKANYEMIFYGENMIKSLLIHLIPTYQCTYLPTHPLTYLSTHLLT